MNLGTHKLVINRCFGGFGLSRAAILRLRELGHPGALAVDLDRESDAYGYSFRRDDPLLVTVVEELGDAANGCNAKLKVVELTFQCAITDRDGMESVDAWGSVD